MRLVKAPLVLRCQLAGDHNNCKSHRRRQKHGGAVLGGCTCVALLRHAVDEGCLLLDAAAEGSACDDWDTASGLSRR
jgi:hypothetical protein